jgi:hypothetical protein
VNCLLYLALTMNDNASIRQAVIDTASELGISDAAICRTVILTRDGHYAGYRFPFDDIQAVWLVDEDLIRFHADDGALLKTVTVGQEPSTRKAA